MDIVAALLFLGLGLALGSAGIFLLFRARLQAEFARGRGEAEVELATLHERLRAADARHAGAEREIHDAGLRVERLQADLRAAGEARSTAEEKANRIPALEERIRELEAALDAQRTEAGRGAAEVARLRTQLDEERKQTEEKLRLLNDAREQLSIQFKNLANEIFEAKSQKFTEQNKTNLATLLDPLRERIGEFQKKVDDVYGKEAIERSALKKEIQMLKDLNETMSKEAVNLTRALKGESKTQGNWGEVILERVLESSGLVRKREYETQVSMTNAEGRRLQPDVIIRLPEGKSVVVDSKVSLVAYERYCSAETDDERKAALAEHVASLRGHIKGLSEKNYQDLYGLQSLDFVLLFVPVEPSFTLAVQHDLTLFQDAFDRKIVIVSPTTLLATLKTIASIWRYENQNKNALKIAEESGRLYDKFVGFVKDLEELGKALGKSRDTYDAAMAKLVTGRGNLVTRAENIKKLGAKANKALPAAVLDDVAGEAGDDDELDALPMA